MELDGPGGVCCDAALIAPPTMLTKIENGNGTATGVGVAPAKRRPIFAEFVQADSSHARKFGGSGLGLAISRRIVERMGGSLRLEKTGERGSTFSLVVPLVSGGTAGAAAEVRSSLADRHVLLVADSPFQAPFEALY